MKRFGAMNKLKKLALNVNVAISLYSLIIIIKKKRYSYLPLPEFWIVICVFDLEIAGYRRGSRRRANQR